MTKFNGPAPLDMLYFKIKGKEGIKCIPLCEVFDGKLNKGLTNDKHVVIDPVPNSKGKAVKYTRDVFTDKITQAVNTTSKTVMGDEPVAWTILDCAILPEGETTCDEVNTFLANYEK